MSRPESVPAMPSLLLEPSAAYTDTDTDLHPSSTIVAGVYQVGGVIGVGTYGEVRYAVSLLTGDRVALKIVDLARFSLETAGIMRKEITILRMLHHPHCIRIIDVHENVPFTGKWCESCACTCFRRLDTSKQSGVLSHSHPAAAALPPITPTSVCATCAHSAAEHAGINYTQHTYRHHAHESNQDDTENDGEGETRQVLVLVQELAAGGELFSLLSHSGPLPEDVARLYFHQLMDGLDHLHTQHIAHRDLKPENLVLTEDFNIKITDFGLATLGNAQQQQQQQQTHAIRQHSNNAGTHTQLPPTGDTLNTTLSHPDVGRHFSGVGSQPYSAPEVYYASTGLFGRGYRGAPCDMWSAAVVLFVMLTGRPPFVRPLAKTYGAHLRRCRHFVEIQCIQVDTLIATPNGHTIKAGAIRKNDVLCGEDGRSVTVASVTRQVSHDAYTIVSVNPAIGRYTVSGNHRLTLQWCRTRPAVTLVRSASESNQLLLIATWFLPIEQQCVDGRTYGLALWPVTHTTDEHCHSELMSLSAWMASNGIDANDTMVTSLPPLAGSHFHLLSIGRAYLSHLVDQVTIGDLFELTPIQLRKMWHRWHMDDPSEVGSITSGPFVGGRRVPLPKRIELTSNGTNTMVEPIILHRFDMTARLARPHADTCDRMVQHFMVHSFAPGMYRPIRIDQPTRIELVYQFHSPLSGPEATLVLPPTDDTRPATFLCMDAVHQSLSIDPTAAGGVALVELNPLGLPSGRSPSLELVNAYREVALATCTNLLRLQPTRIIAFGAATHSHWRTLLAEGRLKDQQTMHDEFNIACGDDEAKQIDVIRFTHDGRSVLVICAPHPAEWSSWEQLSHAIAFAHHHRVPTRQKHLTPFHIDRIASIDTLHGSTDVVNIEVSPLLDPFGDPIDSSRRFALSNGVLTHNSGVGLNMLHPHAKDLLQKLLKISPDERLTLNEVRKHPWMLGPIPTPEELSKLMEERSMKSWNQSSYTEMTHVLSKMRSSKNEQSATNTPCFGATSPSASPAFTALNSPSFSSSSIPPSPLCQPFTHAQLAGGRAASPDSLTHRHSPASFLHAATPINAQSQHGQATFMTHHHTTRHAIINAPNDTIARPPQPTPGIGHTIAQSINPTSSILFPPSNLHVSLQSMSIHGQHHRTSIHSEIPPPLPEEPPHDDANSIDTKVDVTPILPSSHTKRRSLESSASADPLIVKRYARGSVSSPLARFASLPGTLPSHATMMTTHSDASNENENENENDAVPMNRLIPLGLSPSISFPPRHALCSFRSTLGYSNLIEILIGRLRKRGCKFEMTPMKSNDETHSNSNSMPPSYDVRTNTCSNLAADSLCTIQCVGAFSGVNIVAMIAIRPAHPGGAKGIIVTATKIKACDSLLFSAWFDQIVAGLEE